MKLTGIHIDGYGALSNLRMDNLPPGLVVLHGPNEAGKSTLTAFLRYMLFGAGRGELPAALAGGQLGGHLYLTVGGESGTLERFARQGANLTLSASGRLEGESASRKVVGDIDVEMYDAIWSFSLQDLRSFDSLGKEEMRDRLFSGALMGAGRSVSLAQGNLQKKLETLWRPRANSVVGDLIRRQSELASKIADAQRDARRLELVQRELEDAAERQRGASGSVDAAQRDRRRFEALLTALPSHLECLRAQEALALVAEGVAIPDALLEKANELAAEIVTAEGLLAERERAHDLALAALQNRSGPNPWGPQSVAIRELEVLAKDLSVDHVERAVRARQEAGGKLDEALSDAAVRDRSSLAALRLGTAENVRLSRAANEAATTARAADALGERLAASVAAKARHDTARDDLASLPSDVVAAAARLEVDALVREAASVDRQRARVKELRSRAARTQDDIDRLERSHAARLSGTPVDAAGQARFGTAVKDWSRDFDAASLERRAAEGEESTAVETLARLASQAAPAAAADADRAWAALGAPWDVRGLGTAKSDEGNAATLRGCVRRTRDCALAVRLARKGLDAAVADLGEAGVDAGALAMDPPALERRLQYLEAADRLLRRVEVAVGQSSASGVPGWTRVAALALGLLVAAVGLALLAGGVLVGHLGVGLAGAMVLLCGVLVAIGGWFALAPSRPTQGATGLPGLRQQLAEALARAGLPKDATEADVVEARNRVQADLRGAGRVAAHARARMAMGEAEQEVAAARAEMARALGAAAWPSGLDPEGVEAALGQLRALAGARDRRENLLAGAQEAVHAAARRRELATAGMAKVLSAEVELRTSATLLGVPAQVPLLDAPGWLAAVSHRAELCARAEADTADALHATGEVEAWDARVASMLQGLAEGGGTGDLGATQARCARAARAAEDLESAQRRVDQAADKLADAEGAVALARAAATAAEVARADLYAALLDAGLAVDTPAEGMDLRLQAIARARAAETALGAAERGEAQARADAATFMEGVAALAAAVSEPTPTGLGAALNFVARAARLEATAAESARGREHDEKQIRVLADACAAARASRDEHRASLAALLSHAQVADIEGLRALVERGRERTRIEALRRESSRVRDAALGVYASSVADLDTPDEVGWRRRVADAEAAITRAEEERRAAALIEGARAADLSRIRESVDVPSLSAEHASVSAALRMAQRRLAVALQASSLLDQTLQRFRDAHQPAILRTAGGYVSAATGGVYTTVEPDQLGRDLLLIDRDGGRRSSAQLSTGTAELLYLVLRLGLAEDQASRAGHSDGGPPIVLDDVLVNLDPERAAEVARLLGLVAQRHQVLLLTCRPETRDLLRATVRGCTVVEMPRFGSRTGPVAGGAGRKAAAGRQPRTPGLDAGDAAQRLLDVIQEHPDGLGKSALLEQSGVEEALWSAAIQALRTSGRVIQEGVAKGTFYRPVG